MVKHPPGDEIYRDGIVSIFEVDGRKNKVSWSIANPCPFHGFMHMANNLIILDILPKLVFTGQDVSGPQNSLLRCRTILILYNDRSRLGGVSFCGLLFKGKNNPPI